MYLQHCERKPADFVQHELGGAKKVIIGKAAMQNAAVSKFRVGLREFDLRSIPYAKKKYFAGVLGRPGIKDVLFYCI